MTEVKVPVEGLAGRLFWSELWLGRISLMEIYTQNVRDENWKAEMQQAECTNAEMHISCPPWICVEWWVVQWHSESWKRKELWWKLHNWVLIWTWGSLKRRVWDDWGFTVGWLGRWDHHGLRQKTQGTRKVGRPAAHPPPTWQCWLFCPDLKGS